MADQRININIGSSYNGAGMTKALGAVNQLSQTAGKVAGAVGRLGGQFEQLGGSAGKAIGNVSNLIGSLAMGGPIGIAMAGVTALISVWQTHNEKVAEAKRKAEELNKEKKKLAADGMEEIKKQLESQLQLFDQITARWNKLSTAIQNVNKSYTDLAGSFDNVEQAELAKKIQNDVDAAKTEEERQRIIARGNVEMSKLKAQQSIGVAQAQVQRATENLSGKNGATARRENAEYKVQSTTDRAKETSKELENFMKQKNAAYNFFDEIRKLKEAGDLVGAKQKYNSLSARGKEDVDQAERLYNNNEAAQKAVKGAEDRLKAAQQEEEIANNKLLEATNNLTTARLNAETSVKKAEQLERDLLKAQKEAADKQKAENTLKEERIRLTKQLNALQSKSAKDQKAIDEQIKKAKEDLKTAIQNAEQAFANAHINLNAVYNGAVGGTPAGGATGDAEKDNKTARRQAKGMSSSTEWGTGRAFNSDKAARYMESHGKEFGGFSQKEKRDYQDLLDKEKRGSLGAKGRQRLRDYRARDPKLKEQKAAKEAAAAAKKLKDLQQQKETAQQQAYTDIGKIRQQLENLGLK